MKKAIRMASSLAGLLFGLAMISPQADADYVIKDGNAASQTILAFTCGGSKICPGYSPMDITGAAFGVTANPFFVTSTTLATAANQTTVITNLGTLHSDLTTLNTTAGNPIAAGTAIIGKVGIDQTTPGTTNLVAGNITQVNGTAISATNGLYSNILQGNAALSATNGTYANMLQGNAALTSTNTLFAAIANGGNAAAVKPASTAAVATDPAVVMQLNPSSPGIITLGPAAVANALPYTLSSQYPTNATTTTPAPITGNATGTTGAVVGTLAGTASKTTFICGFSVDAVGGTAAVGPITVAGLTGSSMVFQMFSAASGASRTMQFSPCVPASAANTAITITTTANGTATAVDVNSWGYQL